MTAELFLSHDTYNFYPTVSRMLYAAGDFRVPHHTTVTAAGEFLVQL